jgi:hypothetical protein
MEISTRHALLAALRFALPSQAEILHWIPGRVRFRHAALREAQGRIEIASHIASQPGVRSVRVNALLACLIFTYDCGTNEARTGPPAPPVRAGFSIFDFVLSLVDIPIVDTVLDVLEAIRFGRAAFIVMRRRHNGLSVYGAFAYLGLLLVHTSLVDAFLPLHLRNVVQRLRSVLSMLRKIALLRRAVSNASFLPFAA